MVIEEVNGSNIPIALHYPDEVGSRAAANACGEAQRGGTDLCDPSGGGGGKEKVHPRRISS